jgi:hypothetical protein
MVAAVMTDNAWNYIHSRALRELLDAADITHITIRPHCPWQNGKVERFNQTLQSEWAYRTVFHSNTERTAALDPGSSTTTLDAATQPSEASLRSAACHRPDGRVQLGRVSTANRARSAARWGQDASPVGSRADVATPVMTPAWLLRANSAVDLPHQSEVGADSASFRTLECA